MKLDTTRPLRESFLFLDDGLPRFLSLLRSRNVDCSLRCDFKRKGQASKREKEAALHQRS
jgi:hypothetical protein